MSCSRKSENGLNETPPGTPLLRGRAPRRIWQYHPRIGRRRFGGINSLLKFQLPLICMVLSAPPARAATAAAASASSREARR